LGLAVNDQGRGVILADLASHSAAIRNDMDDRDVGLAQFARNDGRFVILAAQVGIVGVAAIPAIPLGLVVWRIS